MSVDPNAPVELMVFKRAMEAHLRDCAADETISF